jgi:hypothetical protein
MASLRFAYADAVSHLLEESIELKKSLSKVNMRSLRRKIDESGVTTTSGGLSAPTSSSYVVRGFASVLGNC